MRYVALLRGINVGGNNIIKMDDLKAAFESLGLTNVTTYIQSGNVVFETLEVNQHKLVKTIEASLSKIFGYTSRVAIVSQSDLNKVVNEAPAGFGKEPDKYRYDVIFLLSALNALEALKQIPVNPEVDKAVVGPGVIYFQRLISKATQSKLSRVVGTPLYKEMTIRNWGTTKKLSEIVTP